MSIKALREQRNTLAKEVRNLLDNHPGKEWKAEHQTQYDGKVEEIGRIDDEIKRLQTAADLDADSKFDDAVEQVSKERARAGNGDPSVSLFAKFLRNGFDTMSNEEIRTFRNTMSTTTPGEGGYTVPSLISSTLYDQMKAYGAMRSVAEIIRTADGKPLSFPGSDGTSETGEWIAQNTTATAADPSFTSVSLNVFKASSKIVAVPFELLQDSVLNVESFVISRLAQRLGRLGNTAFTVGTGTTQPDGITTRTTLGKTGTTGQTTTIIYDDLVDVIHALDPSYRSSRAAFMTNDTLLKVIRKIKDSQNRPLWLPSYDAGIARGPGNPDGGYASQAQAVVFDYLLNYPLYVNNDMPTPAANAKSLVFGDLSYYKIRDAMDVTMFRFTDSAYTKLGQVAFLAWARMGGNLVDTSAVKHYAHSAT